MHNRLLFALLSATTSCLTFSSNGHAETMCPTSLKLDMPNAVTTSVTIGPQGQYRASVLAQLTNTHAMCSVNPPTNVRAEVIHRSVALPPSRNGKFFTQAWDEIGDIERLVGIKPQKASTTQVTTAAVLTSAPYAGAPASGMKVVFDCAKQPALTAKVSADTWNSSDVQFKAVDVDLKEVAPVNGERRFDVSCYYEYPQLVYVSFPRQTRADNRDVATNLTKTGFYRVYDLNKDLWGKVCARDCQDSSSQYRGRGEGLSQYIQQCVSTCVNKGW